MKYLNAIMFFLFIIIATSALIFNIIIIQGDKVVKVDFLSETDVAYIEPYNTEETTELMQKISLLVRKNNQGIFSGLVRSKNPIKKFYGFCGFLNSNQDKATSLFKQFLLSNSELNIFYNNQKIKTTLGYAILLLINISPDFLISHSVDNFYKQIDNTLYEAYQKSFANNALYKNLIVQILLEHSTKYSKKIISSLLDNSNSTTGTPLKNRTIEEKRQIARILPYLSIEEQNKIIPIFLHEKDDEIITNILQVISKENNTKDIVTSLLFIFNNRSKKYLPTFIEKYGLLRENSSLSLIKSIIKHSKNSKVIIAGLDVISNYGKSENYDFLKRFLSSRYKEEINLKALKAIIATTYDTQPTDVLNTFGFIVKNSNNFSLIEYVVKFCITHNISSLNNTIMQRLSQKESKELILLSLDFIEKFDMESQMDFVRKLTTDNDKDINDKASSLLKKML